jgi:hypothetical protein
MDRTNSARDIHPGERASSVWNRRVFRLAAKISMSLFFLSGGGNWIDDFIHESNKGKTDWLTAARRLSYHLYFHKKKKKEN